MPVMSEKDNYFTADTRSVAPEIDSARRGACTRRAAGHEGPHDDMRVEWRRPVGYLVLFAVVVAFLLGLLLLVV